MQLWKTAVLQIRSDAPAAAAELSLSAPLHCGHVVVSDVESDYEDQPCKPDIMGDRDIELDQQSNDDVELTCSDLGQTYEIGNLAVQNVVYMNHKALSKRFSSAGHIQLHLHRSLLLQAARPIAS